MLWFRSILFINFNLTPPSQFGGRVRLHEALSLFGGNGCGLAESTLYDERGMIGRATQSLTVRPR